MYVTTVVLRVSEFQFDEDLEIVLGWKVCTNIAAKEDNV
jgi:hypothetical protein